MVPGHHGRRAGMRSEIAVPRQGVAPLRSSSTSDATSGTRERAACRCPAPLCPCCCGRWETFLYTLKAGLRAAASGGRPRPAARDGAPLRRSICNGGLLIIWDKKVDACHQVIVNFKSPGI
jgi:hypothetical protein